MEASRKVAEQHPPQLPTPTELEGLDGTHLRAQYLALHGRPPYSNRPAYIRKRLIYRVQELEQGGLARWARCELDQATRSLLACWKFLLSQERRDPRLPAPGTVLRKTYRGETHEVAVLEHGFEYRGREYSSLTAVARVIGKGVAWNPYVFFAAELGLGKPKGIAGEQAAGPSLAPVVAQIGLAFLLQDALEQQGTTMKELARQSGHQRSRISQILDLALLAPAIVEDLLLGLPRGKVWPVTEEGLRGIARVGLWSKQVEVWTTCKEALSPFSGSRVTVARDKEESVRNT